MPALRWEGTEVSETPDATVFKKRCTHPEAWWLPYKKIGAAKPNPRWCQRCGALFVDGKWRFPAGAFIGRPKHSKKDSPWHPIYEGPWLKKIAEAIGA